MSLKRNFSWMLISKVIQTALAFVTAALINRALGPAGRGLYAELQTWVALFIMFFGLSLDSVIYHFANKSEYPIDDNSKFATIIFLSGSFSLIAVLILTLTSQLRPEIFSATTNKYLLLLNLLIIVSMIGANLLVFLQALGRIKLSAIIGVVQSVLQAAIIFPGYYVHIISILYIIIALIIMQLSAIIIILVMNSHLLVGSISLDIIKKMLKAGIKLHIATVSMFIYTKINQLILFKYCGEHDTGIFSISLNLAFALMFIPSTFQTVLYPRVIHSQDDYDITVKSLSFGFYGWGVIVLFIMLMSKPILLVYGGKDYLHSLNILRILLIATWILPLSSIVAPYCIKLGAFTACSISALILGIISIGLNLLLIPIYSGLGAALSTALTCLMGFSLSLCLLWFLSNNNPLKFLNIKLMKGKHKSWLQIMT